MKNYAEHLAYWYLRLNGFFLISNYVYHQIQEGDQRAYNADADLLAMRPPYYCEEIPHLEQDEQGNQVTLRAPLDSDDWLTEYNGRWLGVIVEVKGSANASAQDVKKAFSKGRMRVALNRLGLMLDVEYALRKLSSITRYDIQEGSILKIVFTQKTIDGPWKTILLSEADEFIVNRMTSAETYLAKSGSRYFFPSELIQYMIWSAKKQERNL